MCCSVSVVMKMIYYDKAKALYCYLTPQVVKYFFYFYFLKIYFLKCLPMQIWIWSGYNAQVKKWQHAMNILQTVVVSMWCFKYPLWNKTLMLFYFLVILILGIRKIDFWLTIKNISLIWYETQYYDLTILSFSLFKVF